VGRTRAAIGSAAFLVVAPGVFGGLMPWWLAGWHADDDVPLLLRVLGALVALAGAAFVVATFARFVIEGVGTPAPVAPTEHLVVGGVYRYVRNPMYIAVLAVIVGQTLFIGKPAILVYAALFWATVASFVRIYEEPALTEQFGEEYRDYQRAVPAWIPHPGRHR
jgi:protein-S-isoprenylcysteine O-methyltransferase Ste14